MSRKRVVAEISLSAFRKNLELIHQKITGKARLIAVIKANGYGHGAVALAEVMEQAAIVSGYAVATFEEAQALRNAGMKKDIMLLGESFPEDFEAMLSMDICPAVFQIESAELLSRAAEETGKTAKVHLKVDTGMGRIGLPCKEEGLALAEKIASLPGLVIEGLFTHFARADETDKSNALLQLKRFQWFLRGLEERGIRARYCHCANSAAILELPQAHFDQVRAGIILYGLLPSEEVKESCAGLSPVMSLKSSVVYIKSVQPGDSISYGGTFTAEHPMRVATIPVGYADGYPRSLSNKGFVLIRGKRASILGRVCMDQMMVDVTDIPEVSRYDEVVLLGEQEGERITAEELGELSGRFNYELVCDISERVPRVYR
ncbi:MAG: alanine racemase [Lachnospiraceae bacterium]|nr:alanine racemase [Lachnospiraceae bacterium]